MTDRLLVVSTDCHAGLHIAKYKPYLEKKYHEMFDASVPIIEEMIEQLLTQLDAGSRDQLAGVVEQYLDIRGYGPVKEASIEEVRARVRSTLDQVDKTGAEAA